MATDLLTNANLSAAQSYPNASHQIAALTIPCDDQPNQDSALVLRLAPGRTVIAVADGMGGGPSGDLASKLAVEALAQAVNTAEHAGQPLRVGILNGFEQAQAQVLAQANGAATTLLVAEIDGRSARLYHVGDSTALICGQRGRVKLTTSSHSPVGYALRSGLLDEESALTHEDRHYVSNMVGFPEMSVELGLPIELSRHDTLLLGSDGVFDNQDLSAVTEAVRRGPLPGALEQLAAQCRAQMARTDHKGEPAGKPDDLTLVAQRLTR